MKRIITILFGLIIFAVLFNYISTTEVFIHKSDVCTINSYNELNNAIIDSLQEGKSELNIRIKNKEIRNDKEAIPTAVQKILNNNPELNYLQSFVYSTDFIRFTYYFSSDTVINMQKSVDKKAKEIISSIIKPGMTEFEKELAIHDYVVKHTRYDYENLKKGNIPEESYTAYGVLIKGKGVCQGYAIAIHKLMSLAGIETRYVTGTANGVSHAWNIVKIKNEYYHLDATLDDPVTYVNGKRVEAIQYKYFNINDKQASKDHVWDKKEFPKCSSSEYSFIHVK